MRESLRWNGELGAGNITGRQASIALQVSVPLFIGAMLSAQRHKSKALEHNAAADLDVVDNQAPQQSRDVWLGLTAAAARVRALQLLPDSTKDRLGATRLSVEIGDRTALELLNAEAIPCAPDLKSRKRNRTGRWRNSSLGPSLVRS